MGICMKGINVYQPPTCMFAPGDDAARILLMLFRQFRRGMLPIRNRMFAPRKPYVYDP